MITENEKVIARYLLDNKKVLRELCNHLSEVYLVDGEYQHCAMDCLKFVPLDGKGNEILLSDLRVLLDAVDRKETKQVKKDMQDLW